MDTNPDITFSVTEKIHGANFSFYCDGLTVEVLKRSGLITDANFFSHKRILKKYITDVQTCFSKIKQDYPTLKAVTIFGELFGGYYPNISNPLTSQPVQKEIHYTPSIDVLVFDIIIVDESDKIYLSPTDIIKYLDQLNLKPIPIAKNITFDEIKTLDPVFVTTIPGLYGLNPINNNFAEGWVVKANVAWIGTNRPIIKIKNNTFIENDTPKANKKIKPKLNNDSSKELDNLIQELIGYCNRMRYVNLLSKIGIEEPMDVQYKLFIEDAIKDFVETLSEDNKQIINTFIRKVKWFVQKQLVDNQTLEKWLQEYNTPI